MDLNQLIALLGGGPMAVLIGYYLWKDWKFTSRILEIETMEIEILRELKDAIDELKTELIYRRK